MDHNSLKASLIALLGNTIFGMTFLFSKIALNTVSPLVLIADRYILAAAAMTIVMLVFKIPVHFSGKKLGGLLLMAFCQPVSYFICETYGLQFSASSIAAVMIALIPVVTTVFGVIFLHEKTTVLQGILICAAVAGVMVMATDGTQSGTVQPLGILLLAGAVLTAAVYNIFSRSTADSYSPFERTYMMALSGLAAFVPLAFLSEGCDFMAMFRPFTEREYLLCVLFLGIAASVGAYFALNYANTYLPVARATSFTSVTPLVSIVAGALLLHEKITRIQMVCSLVIVACVTGVQLCRKKD